MADLRTRRCRFCGVVIYGRSDKVYCSATCRRDHCRARTRLVRIGETTYVGSEWAWPAEKFGIPSLVREYGPNHRVVHQARRGAEALREEAYEKLHREVRQIES